MRSTRRRYRRKLRRLAFVLAMGLAIVVAVCVGRVLTVESRQVRPAGRVEPVEVDTIAVAEALAAALRFETVTGADGAVLDEKAFAGLLGHLEQAFARVHETLEHELVGGHSRLYRWAGSDPSLSPLLFIAHLDVVPAVAADGTGWKQPPFSGAVADGCVWGRGAIDDKGPAVALLRAVDDLLGTGFQPSRTVYLAFGHDEEVGGGRGNAAIARLLAQRGVRFERVLDEGGFVTRGLVPGLTGDVALVGVGEKGGASFELAVAGAGGHSSAPPEWTAVGRVARAVARLEEDPFPARLDGASRLMFDFIAAEVPVFERLLFSNLWLFESLVVSRLLAKPESAALVRTTTAPTIVAGGVKDNVLPERARAVVNFRLLPGDTPESVRQRIEAVIDDDAVHLRPLGVPYAPPPLSSTDSVAFRRLQEVIAGTFPGVVVAPWLLVAATDSRHYQSIARDVYRFTPVRVDEVTVRTIHGVDERVAITNLAEMVAFYVRLLRAWGAE